MPSNPPILFPSLEEILELQQASIERFGGQAGVRDLGLVESALYRPQTGYYEDLPAMAAAMLESFLMNHAFLDGNKRVAFFATDVFLRLNGYKIKVPTKKGHEFLIGLIKDSRERFIRAEKWIREHMVKIGA